MKPAHTAGPGPAPPRPHANNHLRQLPPQSQTRRREYGPTSRAAGDTRGTHTPTPRVPSHSAQGPGPPRTCPWSAAGPSPSARTWLPGGGAGLATGPEPDKGGPGADGTARHACGGGGREARGKAAKPPSRSRGGPSFSRRGRSRTPVAEAGRSHTQSLRGPGCRATGARGGGDASVRSVPSAAATPVTTSRRHSAPAPGQRQRLPRHAGKCSPAALGSLKVRRGASPLSRPTPPPPICGAAPSLLPMPLLAAVA